MIGSKITQRNKSLYNLVPLVISFLPRGRKEGRKEEGTDPGKEVNLIGQSFPRKAVIIRDQSEKPYLQCFFA